MRYKGSHKTLSRLSLSHCFLKPSVVITCLVIWLQILERHSVRCGVFIPVPSQNVKINPNMYHFLQSQQQPSFKTKRSEPPTAAHSHEFVEGSSGHNGDDMRSRTSEMLQTSASDRQPELNYNNNGGQNGLGTVRFGEFGDIYNKQQQDGGFGGQQLHQLLPTGFLFSKSFSQSSSPMSFNQANGAFMEKEASDEPETNGRLGVFSSFNEYDLTPKIVTIRSRPSHFLVANPNPAPNINIKRSQLAGVREGYMCHFKLCQLGASGKRRWSPLFEFD